MLGKRVIRRDRHALSVGERFEEPCKISKCRWVGLRKEMLDNLKIASPASESEIARANDQVRPGVAEKRTNLRVENAIAVADWLDAVSAADMAGACLAKRPGNAF